GGRRRRLLRFRLLHRPVDPAAAFFLPLPLLGFGQKALRPEQRAIPLERIAPLNPLARLLLAPVAGGVVGGGVGPVAVGDGFDQGRPFAVSRPLDRLHHRLVYRQHIVAVDADPRERVGRRLFRHGGRRRLAGEGHADRIPVVLAEKDDRKAEYSRGIARFVEIPLGGGPVAEIGDGD